ncbi:S-adenosyl-L-methionine-dependent methyltransferase [Xylariomycetidae sp. FL0641]|nr:S-adenosyl-L-methionine-dependent methyltransferase [Xylariomycetidae sp. FL0641]
MMATNTWMPKQAFKFDGALLQELQGNVNDKIAMSILNDLPPLSPSYVIHDNGCGYGAVTSAIMNSDPPQGIQVHATDINDAIMGQLKEKLIESPSWPVTLGVMDACNTTFPDNMFDFSFTTFVFPVLNDDVSAAAHILRTLKPGGFGVIAVWEEIPWNTALEKAHRELRGADEPMAPILSKAWYKKERVEQATKDAGWNPRDVEFLEKTEWVTLGADIRRWATIAWGFLARPEGGWKQTDEDRWDEVIDSIVRELLRGKDPERGGWYRLEDGLHQIRMTADVAIMRKQE